MGSEDARGGKAERRLAVLENAPPPHAAYPALCSLILSFCGSKWIKNTGLLGPATQSSALSLGCLGGAQAAQAPMSRLSGGCPDLSSAPSLQRFSGAASSLSRPPSSFSVARTTK